MVERDAPRMSLRANSIAAFCKVCCSAVSSKFMRMTRLSDMTNSESLRADDNLDDLAESDVLAGLTILFHGLELLVIDFVGRSLGQRLDAAEQVGNHIQWKVLGAECL
jgi:hypothetical protein